MDSSIGQQCYAQAEAFKKAVNVGSVIVTKLDGHAKGGGALSAVAATQSPILFIGQGEHFSDFEQFEAASFIKRLLGLGDLGKMVEIVKDVFTEGDQKKMMGRIQEGKFSYRDLKTQYQSVLKLGPLNQFASLIPGLGQQLMSQGGSEKDSIERVKRQICMLDSMNEQELDGDKNLTEERKKKIARGSGTSLIEIEAMIANYTQIKKLIEKFGKTKMGNNVNDAMRNPKQIMSQLGSVLKPDMIEKMGGMDNIMNMVKQMGAMEKKGELKDLNDMMKATSTKKKK
jgi:signal recognition particle subunit SRP54